MSEVQPSTVLVVADLHAPQIHERAFDNLVQFVADAMPDRIVVLASQTAWCDPQDNGGSCSAFVSRLERLREVHARPIVLQTSSLPVQGDVELAWSNECTSALSKLGIYELRGIYEPAPGWHSLCATGAANPRYPGALAIQLARMLGGSVVCGGTTALAVIGQSNARGGTTRWGLEIGSLVRPPTGGRGTSRTTTMGFALLSASHDAVKPQAIAVQRDGSFTVDGIHYA